MLPEIPLAKGREGLISEVIIGTKNPVWPRCEGLIVVSYQNICSNKS